MSSLADLLFDSIHRRNLPYSAGCVEELMGIGALGAVLAGLGAVGAVLGAVLGAAVCGREGGEGEGV